MALNLELQDGKQDPKELTRNGSSQLKMGMKVQCLLKFHRHLQEILISTNSD